MTVLYKKKNKKKNPDIALVERERLEERSRERERAHRATQINHIYLRFHNTATMHKQVLLGKMVKIQQNIHVFPLSEVTSSCLHFSSFRFPEL